MFTFTSKNLSKITLNCVASIALFTGVASAEPQTATQTFSIGAALQSLSATGDFTLPDFDSTLGTLQSVNLTLTLNNCSSIQVFNTSANAEGFENASLGLLGSVTGPGNLTLNSSLQSSLASGVAQTGLNVYTTGKTTTNTSAAADANSLSIWENQPNGVLDFSYTKGNLLFQGTDLGADNLLFGGKLKGYGKVTVAYTYLTGTDTVDPISTPEPSGKLLGTLAAGAMAVMLFRRKRLLPA